MKLRHACECAAIAWLALLSAACAASSSLTQPRTNALSATVLTRNRASSRISPKASSQNLLYVSNDGGGNVVLYSYPGGQLVGKIYNLSSPTGVCADASGSVWVVESGSSKIVKFPHGSGKAAASLTNSAPNLLGCAVDTSTGNLALTNLGTLQSSGDVWIYASARGKPAAYRNSQLAEIYFAAYDTQGNLFVDGVDSKYHFQLAELPVGGNSLRIVSMNQTVGFPGGLQWDGQYLALGDQLYQGRHDAAVYQIAISGSAGSVEGTTVLSGSCGIGGFAISGAGQKRLQSGEELAMVDPCQNNAKLYAYPAGGYSLDTLTGSQYPLAATISYAQ